VVCGRVEFLHLNHCVALLLVDPVLAIVSQASATIQSMLTEDIVVSLLQSVQKLRCNHVLAFGVAMPLFHGKLEWGHRLVDHRVVVAVALQFVLVTIVMVGSLPVECHHAVILSGGIGSLEKDGSRGGGIIADNVLGGCCLCAAGVGSVNHHVGGAIGIEAGLLRDSDDVGAVALLDAFGLVLGAIDDLHSYDVTSRSLGKPEHDIVRVCELVETVSHFPFWCQKSRRAKFFAAKTANACLPLCLWVEAELDR